MTGLALTDTESIGPEHTPTHSEKLGSLRLAVHKTQKADANTACVEGRHHSSCTDDTNFHREADTSARRPVAWLNAKEETFINEHILGLLPGTLQIFFSRILSDAEMKKELVCCGC